MKLFLTMVVLSWAMAAYAFSTYEVAFFKAAESGDVNQIKSLISSRKVDINVQNENGKTALMLAARRGHTRIAAELIKAGANIEAGEKLYYNSHEVKTTALMEASMYGHRGVVSALLEAGADVHVETKHGKTALVLAAQGGHTGTAELLIEKGKSGYLMEIHINNALIEASEYGRTETVKMLIAKGADLDAQDEVGNTALMYAARKGHTQTFILLVHAGANVHIRSSHIEMTALMDASVGGSAEIVRVLIEKGVDLNHVSGGIYRYNNGAVVKGETALTLASREGHTKIAKMLRAAGATGPTGYACRRFMRKLGLGRLLN